MKKYSYAIKLVIGILFIPFLIYLAFFSRHLNKNQVKTLFNFSPTQTPTPTPFIFTTYTVPNIPSKAVYKIAMIGDSMTAALGPHGGSLSEYLNSLYKKNTQDPQRIIVDNYAKSSNILAVDNELTKQIEIATYVFGPLLSTDYDLILVESYAYNPLSQFGIDEGIRQQNLALDSLMKKLILTRPNMSIVFVATISPNKESYAKVVEPNRAPEEREKEAEERIVYLKNHIEYAKSHKIPVINIYQDSLTTQGDGDIKYINPVDDIHPSATGVDFIDHKIGDFIFNNKVLSL